MTGKSRTRRPRTRNGAKSVRARTVGKKIDGKKIEAKTTVATKTAAEYELTTKRRGELSELAFVFKAPRWAFTSPSHTATANATTSSSTPDTVCGASQIKSTTTMLCGLYRINAHRRTNHGAVPYQPGEVDFLIAHVIPEDAWFILPIALIQDRTSALFPPRHYRHKHAHFAAYREAWHLLRVSN